MIVLLLVNLQQPSLVLEVLNGGTLCDWTPRIMVGLIVQSCRAIEPTQILHHSQDSLTPAGPS